MPDPSFIRRERVTDALLEFERRIRERMLSIDNSECWDLLLNRPPAAAGACPHHCTHHRRGACHNRRLSRHVQRCGHVRGRRRRDVAAMGGRPATCLRPKPGYGLRSRRTTPQ